MRLLALSLAVFTLAPTLGAQTPGPSRAPTSASPIEVEPGVRMGPLRIGMTRTEALALRLPVRRAETGMVVQIAGFDVQFDRNDRLERIEVMLPFATAGVRIAGRVFPSTASPAWIASQVPGCSRELHTASAHRFECNDGALVLHNLPHRQPAFSVEVVGPSGVLDDHAHSSTPLTVRPGLQLGDVRIGMTRAQLLTLGLAGPTLDGRALHLGAYEIGLDANDQVESITMRVAETPGLRIGSSVLPPSASASDLVAALQPCNPTQDLEGARSTTCQGGSVTAGLAGPVGIVFLSVHAVPPPSAGPSH